MRRRWMLAGELLLLLVLCAGVAWMLLRGPEKPDRAVDVKVQLPGVEDKAYLFLTEAGELKYRIFPDRGGHKDLDVAEFTELLYAKQRSRSWMDRLLNINSPTGVAWVTLGFLGQLLFTGRMVVQWLASEKKQASVVPPIFWWMSLVGSSMLLVYFVWRKDPVAILGQAFGWFIYVRNLYLIHRGRPEPAQEPEPVAAA